MPLSTSELLSFLGAIALLGTVLYFLLRTYDRHLDGPALRSILAWARDNNHRILEVRKRRGGSGRLGTNPRIYSVTVSTETGESRMARIEFKPTFAGVDPNTMEVAWDQDVQDSLLWSETLRLPEGP